MSTKSTSDAIKVSVIIPVYKCEKYIASCIESILSQTMQEFQLILVDDGSPDNAPVICDEYARSNSRILVIHKENGGVSSARNAGLEAATGEYVSFVDSDDYIDSDFLEHLFETAVENNADLVASGLRMEYWNEQQCVSTVSYSFSQDKVYGAKTVLEAWDKEYPAICLCGPWCKLYKRSIIEKANIRFLPQLNCGEDTYFNMEFLEQEPMVYTLSKNYYHYRRGDGDSLFSRFHRDTYEVHACVYGKKRVVMNKVGCSSDAMKMFENTYFSLLLGGIHEYYRFYDQSTTTEKIELMKKIANDSHVAQLKANQIVRYKDKLFFILLSRQLYRVMHWLFKIRYKIR